MVGAEGKRLSRIDALLFDATGTLLSVRGGVGELYAETGAAHGLELDAGLLELAFRSAIEAAPPLAFPEVEPRRRSRAERDWWKRVVSQTVREATRAAREERPARVRQDWERNGRFEAFFDDLFRRFSLPAAWRIEADAPRVLATLAGRGYALGVLSNFDSRLPPLLSALGLGTALDAVATSASIGAAKPDPRAFARALALLGREPHTAAYVGDSPETDGRGAARAGLLPVLLRASLPPDVAGVRIERLTELLKLFREPPR